VCQLLYASLGSHILDALNILVRGSPNADHFAIASLAKRGRVRAIITTNFDPYIEEALLMLGVNFEIDVGEPSRSLQKALSSHKRDCLFVYKPHGSITQSHSIVMTMRQAGQPATSEVNRVIEAALRNAVVLLVGYSGSDDDLFPALLRGAAAAKRVFWAAWERSLTANAWTFARRCPTCSIVWCDGKSILQAIAPETVSPQQVRSASDELVTAALRDWATAIPQPAWTNFFSELLLSLDPEVVDGRLIVQFTEETLRSSPDRLAAARAMRNRALGLIASGNQAVGRAALAEVMDAYLAAGRPREYTELAVVMTETFSSAVNVPVTDDVLAKATWFSGKSYDSYSMGLCGYAAAIELETIGKISLARNRLVSAAGFARRAGDMTTLRKCLVRLSSVAATLKDDRTHERCERQLSVLDETLSLVDANEPSGENPILEECEQAAHRWKRKLIVGEITIGTVIMLLTFVGARFVTHSLRTATFGTLFCGGAYLFGKLRAALKSTQYPSIEESG